MTDVLVRHEADRQRFVVDVDGEEAELTYTHPDPTTLDLQHTWTPPAARGRGVAGALVRAALDHARHAGAKVIPSCPYVAAYIERHPDDADLLA